MNLRILLFLCFPICCTAQYQDFHTVTAGVDFADTLRTWDGFGVNYVQTAHTRDYEAFPQEYGGFSLLNAGQKDTILDMIFGPEGLQPGLVKMFLDPLHQKVPGGPYDHRTTTSYMREFVREGLQRTRARGGDLQIITTLYGPPAWMTKQQELRGRDLDPKYEKDLAAYLIDWAKFLHAEGFPLRYISLHNEGEDWRRWPVEGDYANFDHGHDYNLYWPPEQVADFLNFMPPMMEEAGLAGVRLTPGETSRWFQFHYSGYANAILENTTALNQLGLLTSHNFYNGDAGHRWFSGTSNIGTDRIREERPGMHAWVTSASWGDMDIDFLWQIWMNIYLAKVNGYIPWACIQRPAQWIGGDPNPGTAFRIRENGTFEVLPGYYLYKQVTRAGQPGMAVANTHSLDSEIQLIGFAGNNTGHPDNFIVLSSGVHATWRADAVDLRLNNHSFRISTKDPTANWDLKGNLQQHTRSTPEGYRVELAIPWSGLEHDPSDTVPLPFQLDIREGEYALAGQLQWRKNGRIQTGNGNSTDENTVHLSRFHDTIAIDGETEAAWAQVEEQTVLESVHPNTDPELRATWKGGFDEQNLYLLIEVRDKTNLQGRRVAIELEGTPYERFKAYRSSEEGALYQYLGTYEVENGRLLYELPFRTATTFFGVD